MTWLSAHVHFDGSLYGAEGDRIIVELIPPILATLRAEGLVERYFFIRYAEQGTHIRFRVRVASMAVSQLVSDLVAADASSVDARLQVTGLRWVPYEPEIERYGGPRGLRVAERFFETSSNLAISLLREGAATADRGIRLGKGLIATTVAVHALSEGNRNAGRLALLRYAANLRGATLAESDGLGDGRTPDERCLSGVGNVAPYVEELWSRLECGESVSTPFDRFHAELKTIYSELANVVARGEARLAGRIPADVKELIAWVRSSYVHMTNNRLGILPIEEAHIAELAAHGLQNVSHGASQF